MVDLDAMNRHVVTLNRWKAEVQDTMRLMKEVASKAEQSLSGADQSSSAALSNRVDDLAKQLDEHAAAVALLPHLQDTLQTIAGEVDDFKAKFPPERVDALDFMLTWFQDNQEALGILLSLGDDQTGISTSPTTAASSGAGEPAGAAPDQADMSSGPASQSSPAPSSEPQSGQSGSPPMSPGAETAIPGDMGAAGAPAGETDTTAAPAAPVEQPGS